MSRGAHETNPATGFGNKEDSPHVSKNIGGENTAFLRDGRVIMRRGPGKWQTKSQFVFDENERSLIRRTYSAWNWLPSLDLDFQWKPDAVDQDNPGRIEGSGRLVWRPQGKPAYDRSSIYAEYVGVMKDGKPNGKGAYFDDEGFIYEGAWSEGQFEGIGRLQFPNGDEYVGNFFAGEADGQGRYLSADGEIYTGEFSEGRRSGKATVSLPNGGSFQSQWLSGQEIPESRRVRLAQLGAASAAPDDVRIGIVVDRQPIKNGMLGYTSSNTADGLNIRPANMRLMDIWKGSGEIQRTAADEDPDRGGIFFFNVGRSELDIWPADGLPPLLLILDVENRGSHAIQVVDAYLDVAKSSVDRQPMVVATHETCGDLNAKFSLGNFGWGPMEQTSLRLSIAGGALAWHKNLGLIEGGTIVDVEDCLRDAGVDFDALKSRNGSFSCKSKSQSECFSETLRSGIFGRNPTIITRHDVEIRANFTGSLNYKWKDSEGHLNDRQSPFDVHVVLGTLLSAAECEGGGIDPLHTKKPITLKLDQAQYKLAIDFRSSIDAGRVARYSLPVRAPKSSHHNYRIVLVLADGREIKSRQIDLLYFYPNNWGRKDI